MKEHKSKMLSGLLLILVTVCIGIIVIICLKIFCSSNFLVSQDWRNRAETRAVLERIAIVLDAYRADSNNFPDEIERIFAYKDNRTPLGLFDERILLDAWNREILYSVRTDGYTLTSRGRDDIFGSEDDIVLQNNTDSVSSQNSSVTNNAD